MQFSKYSIWGKGLKQRKKPEKSVGICKDLRNPCSLNESKYFIKKFYYQLKACIFNKIMKCFSSIVRSSNVLCLEYLTRDRGVAGLSLTGVTALSP